MTRSGIDFERVSAQSTVATAAAEASSLKPQAARTRKNAAQEWVEGTVEKLNRMRTDEAYRQEIAAKAK